MSQHSDILSHEISKGIKRGEHVLSITQDIAELLQVLEYDDSMTELTNHRGYVYRHAKWMRTQKNGIYGVTHTQLDKFINDLWNSNQWLEA